SCRPTVPNVGPDPISAGLDAVGSGAVTVTYAYAAIDHCGVSGVQMAAPGSLAGSSVQVTLTAYDSANNPIRGAPVYVSFGRAAEIGRASCRERAKITGVSAACIEGRGRACQTGSGRARTPELSTYSSSAYEHS